MILKTDFETILTIWKNDLWPSRSSMIESHSAMLLDGTYDLKNYVYKPNFFVYMVDGKIAGCNSGHKCCDNTYRSRGLFVYPEYRKQGIGTKLLTQTIQQGLYEDCITIWSYPRYESWSTYESANFKLVSDWAKSETGDNAYCIYSKWKSNL
jgi:GNAT superfamily N-acetyltransferase